MIIQRTIRRMKNRKYYDPAQSKYITIAGMREYAQDKEVVLKVVDHADTDITNDVLKQIVATLPFTNDELLQLIRG